MELKEWIPVNSPEWCEIWLSSDSDEAEVSFRRIAEELQIPLSRRFAAEIIKNGCRYLRLLAKQMGWAGTRSITLNTPRQRLKTPGKFHAKLEIE